MSSTRSISAPKSPRRRPAVCAAALSIGLVGAMLVPVGEVSAHDIRIPLSELKRGVRTIDRTIEFFGAGSNLGGLPNSPDEHRRVLGAAEIELALGNRERALQMLIGRLADPRFAELPEYVSTLLMTSQILEVSDDPSGAMHYSELALKRGGDPEQMAEAGARWFRVARRIKRLDRRLEMYELWKARGGEQASGSEVAAEVMYEVGFALRAYGRRGEARKLLATVPSESEFGSRAAYLAGVVYVEEGDLENAERWFVAVMDWGLPALAKEHRRLKVERKIRDLAALSAARLRYERGDLTGAEQAYRKVSPGSQYEAEACWERAHLDVERGTRRGALKRAQCVIDLGAKGTRFVDVKLFKASLLAHMSRYTDSIESYKALHEEVEAQRDMFAKTLNNIQKPAAFLFSAMERNSVEELGRASPGPGTLLADAWNGDVDRAYRVDRGVDEATDTLGGLLKEIDRIAAIMASNKAFVGHELRRTQLQRVLQEIHHLQGHAGQERFRLGERHASTKVVGGHDHSGDEAALNKIIAHLDGQAKKVEAQLVKVERSETERRAKAITMIREIRAEIVAVQRDAAQLDGEAARSVNAVARSALREVHAALQDASMRAEVGVLDTFWLRKQHRTKAIEDLLQRQKESERQVTEAIEDLSAEEIENLTEIE